ncbi:MAG: RimK domain-containing protein ATP-grasp, partial [Candidatus Dormiibacterota bacterium]
MVVVIGLATDSAIRLVCSALDERRMPFLVLDPRAIPRYSGIDVLISEDGQPTGSISTPDGTIELGAVTAVFARLEDTSHAASEAGVARGGDVDEALASWLDRASALVVNRPSAQVSNSSKPLQHGIIRRAGLRAPQTVVSNIGRSVHEMGRDGEDRIYKSVGGTRSIVRPLDPSRADPCAVSTTPTMYQRRVPGTDVRAHVIGNEVDAVEILSDDVDYRYPTAGRLPKLCPTRLPVDVQEACVALTSMCGLSFAGIDLRRTPSGEFYCFEVNPSPAFSY